jgi:hypothetical protein
MATTIQNPMTAGNLPMNMSTLAYLLLLMVASDCGDSFIRESGQESIEVCCAKLEHRQPVSKEININQARQALIKLVDGDLTSKLEKYTAAGRAKRIVEHIASKKSTEALRNEKPMRCEDLQGIEFIGDWAIILRESRFYIVVGDQGNIIWVKGVFKKTRDNEYGALINAVSVGVK